MNRYAIENYLGKGNLIKLQCESKVFHEVKIYSRTGKLKKVVSEKSIHRRHWKIAELAAANKRGFSNAGTRKIQESLAIEQFEDEEFC